MSDNYNQDILTAMAIQERIASMDPVKKMAGRMRHEAKGYLFDALGGNAHRDLLDRAVECMINAAVLECSIACREATIGAQPT